MNNGRDHERVGNGAETWSVDRGSASFELTVRHRSGPVRLVGTLEGVAAAIEVDGSGTQRFTFAADTTRIEVSNDRRPRWRAGQLLDTAGYATVRFESTSVTDLGAGRMRVAGRLVGATASVPLELELSAAHENGYFDMTASTNVDHRRLGVSWVPAGPLRAATDLIVRLRLHAAPGPEPRALRRRRSEPLGSRYRFMAGRLGRGT